MMKNSLLLFLTLFPLYAHADIAVDAATPAIRASMMNAQDILSSPPLPSLTTDKNYHLTVTAANSSIKANGRVTGMGLDFGSYSHTSKGPAFGLGISSPTYGSFSYFLFGTYNSTSGSTHVIRTDGSTMDAPGLKTSIGAYGLGLQYLLFGTPQSFIQMSTFAGGLYFNLDHSFPNDSSISGVIGDKTTINIKNKGPMAGTQLRMNIGNFYIAPYFFYYIDLSNHCVDFPLEACGAKLNNTFSAIGLNLGWGKLSVGAYTNTTTKLKKSDLNMSKYQLCYTFDL